MKGPTLVKVAAADMTSPSTEPAGASLIPGRSGLSCEARPQTPPVFVKSDSIGQGIHVALREVGVRMVELDPAPRRPPLGQGTRQIAEWSAETPRAT